MVTPDRQQMTIWRMRVACWISRVTRANAHAHAHTPEHPHTRREKYEILIAFPLQQWFRERASMLRYTYVAYLVEF